MKPEEIKERKELVDIFFDKDSISNKCLTQNHRTEMTESTVDGEFLKSFFIEAFNFCGCGCLHMSIKFIRDVLNCYEDREEDNLSPYLNLDKAEEVCGNEDITDFMLHWLDSVGLTDHGISIYGSWLTKKGEALRDYLKEVVKEEEE